MPPRVRALSPPAAVRRRTRTAAPNAAVLAGAATALLLATAVAADDGAGPEGDPERGETLYASYKCYACHGWRGETGDPLTGPRLVPMRWPLPGFIAYVQQSPSPQMPAYPDAPVQALADVHAWLAQLQPDAPAVEDTPLLDDIRRRRADD